MKSERQLEVRRQTNRDLSLLILFPNAHSGQGQAKLQSETQNSTPVHEMCDRNQIFEPSSAASHGAHQQEVGIGHKAGAVTGVIWYSMQGSQEASQLLCQLLSLLFQFYIYFLYLFQRQRDTKRKIETDYSLLLAQSTNTINGSNLARLKPRARTLTHVELSTTMPQSVHQQEMGMQASKPKHKCQAKCTLLYCILKASFSSIYAMIPYLQKKKNSVS